MGSARYPDPGEPTSDLASTSAGKGASLVGAQDAGGFYAGTTVEAELQEIGPSLHITGTPVASGGTLTPAAVGDYFHVTGTTAIDFITTTGRGAGAVLELYFDSALTLNHATGSPPGSTYPLRLVGGVNASMAAGSKIRFRRDVALTQWVEMHRGEA